MVKFTVCSLAGVIVMEEMAISICPVWTAPNNGSKSIDLITRVTCRASATFWAISMSIPSNFEVVAFWYSNGA